MRCLCVRSRRGRHAHRAAWGGSSSRPLVLVAAAVALSCASPSCDREPAPTPSNRRKPVDPEDPPQRPHLGSAPPRDGAMVGSPTFATRTGALVYPTYVGSRQAAAFLRPNDVVFVVRAEKATYVYPRVTLSPHHVVNETIDQKPVAVTYCQLSECATLFSRVVDGEVLTFGWVQSLYCGTLVMGDYASKSLWTQFNGECFQGSKRGRRLTSLGDIDRMPWRAAQTLPHLKVLEPVVDVASSRSFVAAMENEELGLRALGQVAQPDGRLPPYDRGLGVSVRGEAVFFRLEDVRRRDLIESSVGGWPLLVVSDEASQTARMFRRSVGGRVLTFQRRGSRLSDRQTGSLWDREGRCVDGDLAGKRLERPLYSQSWWFAWSAFWPRSRFWSAGS